MDLFFLQEFPIYLKIVLSHIVFFLLSQEAVINELKSKTKQVQEKKLLHQDEVYNGALEDILLGLKSEPYRRADAVRRSQRRRIDSNRLSRTMEELEFWCGAIREVPSSRLWRLEPWFISHFTVSNALHTSTRIQIRGWCR